MPYKFLLFDLDHTLLDFATAEDIALNLLLQEAGVHDIQAYKGYYIPMNQALWEDLALGKISKTDLINTRFARLFQHFHHEVDGQYMAGRYQHFLGQQGQILDGADKLLDTLTTRGYQIFGATNGITKIQQGRLARSGLTLYFEDVFISEMMHTQKPEKAFYEKIAEQINGFHHTQALMIGDSLSADISGGNNAGIDTVWYNPDRLANTTSAKPTYTVHSYQELLALL